MPNITNLYYSRNDFENQNEQLLNLKKTFALRSKKYTKVYSALKEIDFTPKKSTMANIMAAAK